MKFKLHSLLLILHLALAGCNNTMEENLDAKIFALNTSLNVSEPYIKGNERLSKIKKHNYCSTEKFQIDSEFVALSKPTFVYAQSDEIALVQLFSQLSEQAQFFYLDTKKDTVIIGRKGTVIHIDANSFIGNSGSLVKGEIKFELLEYVNKSEFLYASLSTHTHKNDLLESAGTIYMKAYSGNEAVSLAKGKSIRFEMPTNGVKENMELFSGVRDVYGRMKWNAFEKKKSNRKVVYKVNVKEKNESFRTIQLVEENTVIRIKGGKELYSNKYINSKVDLLSEARKLDTISILLEVDEHSVLRKTNVLVGKNKRNRKLDIYNFSILKTERYSVGDEISLTKNFTLLPIVNDRIVKLNQAFNNFSYKGKWLKSLKKSDWVGRPLEVTMQRIISVSIDSLNDDSDLLRQKRLEAIEMKMAANGSNDLNADQIEYYMFTTSKLGWINVDRFLHLNGPKVKFVLEDKNFEKSKVTMVFKNFQSVLPAYMENGKVIFDHIPLGEPVTIIAIKMVNGLPSVFKKEMNTSRGRYTQEVSFTPLSFSELQKEVEKLNGAL